MGYAHSWKRRKSLEPGNFALLVKDVQALTQAAKIELETEFAESGCLIENMDFNNSESFRLVQEFDYDGSDSQEYRSHEDMLAAENNGLYYEYCKTRRYPYDLVVMASLLALKHRFPETVVSSDGDYSDWEPAVELCQQVLGFDGAWISTLRLDKECS